MQKYHVVLTGVIEYASYVSADSIESAIGEATELIQRNGVLIDTNLVLAHSESVCDTYEESISV